MTIYLGLCHNSTDLTVTVYIEIEFVKCNTIAITLYTEVLE